MSEDSAVGMHHKSSRSIAYASSANFGNWPVAVSVAEPRFVRVAEPVKSPPRVITGDVVEEALPSICV